MTACPSLQEAMRLIQEEFAFDGYMDNGLEALIMGMKATGATLKAQDKGEVEGGSPESISIKGTQGSTMCPAEVSQDKQGQLPACVMQEESLGAHIPPPLKP